MMIRQFKVGSNIYDGYFLPDGSGDIECLTPSGRELFFSWEFELISPDV